MDNYSIGGYYCIRKEKPHDEIQDIIIASDTIIAADTKKAVDTIIAMKYKILSQKA